MRNIIGLVIVLGLASGLVGAFAYDQRGSNAGAAPPPPAPQRVAIASPLDGQGNVRVHEQGTADVNVVSMPAAPTPQGRLIDLGTHNESGLIAMPMVNVSDCGHISILAVVDGAGSQRVMQRAFASADGTSAPVAIAWEADVGDGGTSIAGDVWASLHNVPVTLPFVSVLVDNSPINAPRNFHAWIWCQP